MKAEIKTLGAESAGEIELADTVFAMPVRKDILHRVVVWQLAKRRATAAAVKERGDVAGTTKKFVRQKGSGGARHGNRKANLFRGGGRAHGPKARDFAHKLPKKVRALGLKTALSAKAAAGELIVIEDATLDAPKTKMLKGKLDALGVRSALVIDGKSVNDNFSRAARMVPCLDVLPAQGANVYDILRRDTLVLTRAGVEELEARFQ
ncbi:MAG: 50S ribosomal protein L4 [Pseudomonadota bacterium]